MGSILIITMVFISSIVSDMVFFGVCVAQRYCFRVEWVHTSLFEYPTNIGWCNSVKPGFSENLTEIVLRDDLRGRDSSGRTNGTLAASVVSVVQIGHSPTAGTHEWCVAGGKR